MHSIHYKFFPRNYSNTVNYIRKYQWKDGFYDAAIRLKGSINAIVVDLITEQGRVACSTQFVHMSRILLKIGTET